MPPNESLKLTWRLRKRGYAAPVASPRSLTLAFGSNTPWCDGKARATLYSGDHLLRRVAYVNWCQAVTSRDR